MDALQLLRTALDDRTATFRDGQREAIDAAVNRRARVLIVQRTGWGKSIVYFLATRLLRDAGGGPTIIISPLLALIQNQLDAAARVGIRAGSIASDNTEQWEQIEQDFVSDKLDVLLISPERLSNQRFQERCLTPVSGRLGMLVVDEAHCISDWGHDFRPDYRRIGRVLKLLPANIPVIATTATANRRVVDDVCSQLGDQVEHQRGRLTRESLRLQALVVPSPAARLAWLADHVPTFDHAGIIYASTVRTAQRVAQFLRDRGVRAEAYHGGVETDRRRELESALLDNRIDALVATSALGMGFDKPDLGFVIHFQAPQSVVHYYQQVGRAGRGIQRAYGVLLGGREDDDIVNYFIDHAFPRKADIERLLDELAGAEEGLQMADILEQANFKQGQLEKILKFLAVEERAPVVKQGSRWFRTPNEYELNEERIAHLSDQRRQEWAQMQEYLEHRGCLMQFLANALDDSSAPACGACASCVGHPLVPPTYSDENLRLATQFLRHTDGVIQPRKQWPAGNPLASYGWTGKLGSLALEEGRFLCRWRDEPWGTMVYDGKRVGCFADELVAECAALIGERWCPEPRPTWVTCIPSRRRPTLVPDFAARLAGALGIPFVDCITATRENEPQKTMQNRYYRTKNLDGLFAVERDEAMAGPVLLVDDVVDSRWTLTVAGALLKEAVGAAVYPLALASTSRH